MSRRTRGKATRICIVRRKGGMGTTTVAKAVAEGLAMEGYETLYVEGDDNRRGGRNMLGLDMPGGRRIDDSLTSYQLFVRPDEGLGNIDFKVHLEQKVGEIPNGPAVMRARGWQPSALRVVPGSRALRKLETQYLMQATSANNSGFTPYMQFSRALDALERDFDFIIIDPPSMLSLITTNEILAADGGVLFLADFDPDSPADFEEAHDFYRQAATFARNLSINPPRVLGVVYNKYKGDAPQVADAALEKRLAVQRQRHKHLLEAYTKPHFAEDNRTQVPAIIPYPTLAVLPFDDITLEASMAARLPMHIFAPETQLGIQMWNLVQSIKTAVNVAVGAGR